MSQMKIQIEEDPSKYAKYCPHSLFKEACEQAFASCRFIYLQSLDDCSIFVNFSWTQNVALLIKALILLTAIVPASIYIFKHSRNGKMLAICGLLGLESIGILL